MTNHSKLLSACHSAICDLDLMAAREHLTAYRNARASGTHRGRAPIVPAVEVAVSADDWLPSPRNYPPMPPTTPPLAEIVTDPEYIDAHQDPTILDCSTAIDDAVAVDIVERVMKVLRPAPLSPLWIAAIRADLEREFGLTDEEER